MLNTILFLLSAIFSGALKILLPFNKIMPRESPVEGGKIPDVISCDANIPLPVI